MHTTVGTADLIDLSGLRLLRLHHAGHGNSIDTTMLMAMVAALQPTQAISRLTPPLVIEGDNGCFSAGYALNELARFDGTAAIAFSRLAHQAVDAIEAWPGVTIALVRGPCLGPGLELALACDLIVATPGARFGLPGLAFGLMPCAGGLRRLGTRSAPAVVRELFLIGRVFKTGEAHAVHLIDRIVGPTTAAERVAQRWGQWDRSSVEAIRSLRLSRQGHDSPGMESDLFAAGFVSGDIQRRLAGL